MQSQLSLLESYFASQRAMPLHQVYLLVQHASNLIPRLYLQITVGSVYIASGQVGAREVLAELLQAVMGVQHPMRGLFVRYYLAQCMRDKLPDAPPPAGPAAAAPPTAQGSVLDAIAFLLGLLKSMNRLWVRLGASTAQHASVLALGGAEVGAGAAAAAAAAADAAAAAAAAASSTASTAPAASAHTAANSSSSSSSSQPQRRKRAERERLELRVLLGSILSRLASLDNLTLPLYASTVLPGILGEVVGCRDRWAQAYLLEAAIQVFPGEWHEACLGGLLRCLRCTQADPAMVRVVLQGLMERLAEGMRAEGLAGDSSSSGGAAAAAAAGVDSVAVAELGGGVGGSPSAAAAAAAAIAIPAFPEPAEPARQRALRVFSVLLGHINALGAQPGGAFVGMSMDTLPTASLAPAAAAASAGSSSPGKEQQDGVVTPQPSPAAQSSRDRSLALRHTIAASSALEGMVNLLDVYSSLLAWGCTHLGVATPAYCDAILAGAASYVGGVMGTLPVAVEGSSSSSSSSSSASSSSLESASGVAESLRLSARAIAALRSLLEEGGGGGAQQQQQQQQPSTPDATELTFQRAMSTLSSATGAFSLHSSSARGAPHPRPRLFLDTPCSRAVIALLNGAQGALGLQVLRLEHYAPLLGSLSHVSKRRVASRLLHTVVASGGRVAETAVAGRLLEALGPLFRPDTSPGVPEPAGLDSEQSSEGGEGGGSGSGSGSSGGGGGDACLSYEGEHLRLVELIALLGSAGSAGSSGAAASPCPYSLEALATDFAILLRARDALAAGGPRSVLHTFPPLIQRFLGLGGAVAAAGSSSSLVGGGVTPRALASAVLETTRALAVGGHTEQAAAIFCQCAEDASVEAEASAEYLSQGECSMPTCVQRCQGWVLSSLSLSLSLSHTHTHTHTRSHLYHFPTVRCAPSLSAHLLYDDLPSSRQTPCLLRIIAATGAAQRLSADLRAALVARACSAADHLMSRAGAVAALLACARMLSALKGGSSSSSSGSSSSGGGGGRQPPTPLLMLQKALRAADAAASVEAPGLFLDCLGAALELQCSAAFVGELALLCSEYVSWAGRASAPLRSVFSELLARFEGLHPKVVAATGKSFAVQGASAAADVSAAAATAATAAAAAPEAAAAAAAASPALTSAPEDSAAPQFSAPPEEDL